MARPRKKTRSRAAELVRSRRARAWHALTDRELLALRLCDLDLRVRGSELEARVKKLYVELDRRRLRFRPHWWLSTEWFSPDGVPGFAIPFYLAQPRLIALERRQIGEVEGGDDAECMQLIRHEAAHALDSAFALHRRAGWRDVFGAWTTPYTRHYRPKPYSKRFVRHIDRWYAQSHPAEDFAETLAVWLDPASRWRTRYEGWGALEKLRYVDRMMKDIAGKRAEARSREEVEPLTELTLTLGEYYERKRKRYGADVVHAYDRDLARVFARRDAYSRAESAVEFLRRAQPRIRFLVARTTGEPGYAIDRVLLSLIRRSAALDLVVPRERPRAEDDVTWRLASHTAKYLRSGFHQFAR